MRLTRRGWALVGVIVAGTGLAYAFGPRSLDALLVPCLVALAGAAVQAYRAPTPEAERVLPDDGEIGDAGVVVLRFDVDSPYPARVEDALPAGLTGEAVGEAVIGAEPVRYRIRYARRGRHSVGPLYVYTTDVLGLIETRRTVTARDRLLVYPRVRNLPPATVARIRAEFADRGANERDEFDGLREYTRNDSLRDIHWKSSAKRQDLIVQKFAGARPQAGVTLAAGASRGAADEMAEAVASVGIALLTEGVPVTLRTAEASVTADPEEPARLLAYLAQVGHGRAPEPGSADVAVDAREDGVRIRIGGHETTFATLLAEHGASDGPPVGAPLGADTGEADGSREVEA